jgi:S-adenosylmethionine synthetase
MPMPIHLAHKPSLGGWLRCPQRRASLPWVRPDGKSQVTVEYSYGKPKRIHTVLISTQHSDRNECRTEIRARDYRVCHQAHVLPAELVDDESVASS